MNLVERIQAKDAVVGVVGMGHVGLPLAASLAGRGLAVRGLESDPDRRRAIELGKMPFLEPGADEALHQAVSRGNLTVHEDPDAVVSRSDVILLCVGTPLSSDLRPAYSQLRRALEEVTPHLRPGQLLIQRSTVSPGTLEKVVLPYLREQRPDVADEVLLAACPERIAEGKAMEELASLPEIVGGVDSRSAEAASALFRVLSPKKQIHVTDPTSAELAKLFTNVYRYVNFALANEFALLGEYYGVDTHSILRMANDGYPRASIPMPGPAGGPCLSKDGYFLVEELSLPDFVLTAWKLNDSTPAYVVRRLARRLAAEGVALSDIRVAVLGRTFKRDSDDERQSPSARIIELLQRSGAQVAAHDPFLSGPPLGETLQGAGAFVLATNHSIYETMDPVDVASLLREPRVGLDCWAMLDRSAFGRAGIRLITFGVGEEL